MSSAERYKLLEWLNYITRELHKNFGPKFAPALSDEAKAFFKDRVMGKFKYVDSQLAGRDYLMGKQFIGRRRLSVHDVVMGRTDEVRPRTRSRICWPTRLASAPGRRCRKR